MPIIFIDDIRVTLSKLIACTQINDRGFENPDQANDGNNHMDTYIVGSQVLWRLLFSHKDELGLSIDQQNMLDSFIHDLHQPIPQYNPNSNESSQNAPATSPFDLDIRVEPYQPSLIMDAELLYNRANTIRNNIVGLKPKRANQTVYYLPEASIQKKVKTAEDNKPIFYKLNAKNISAKEEKRIAIDLFVIEQRTKPCMNIDLKADTQGNIIYDPSIETHKDDVENLCLKQRKMKVYDLKQVFLSNDLSETNVRKIAHIIKKAQNAQLLQLGFTLETDSAYLLKRFIEDDSTPLYKAVFKKIGSLYMDPKIEGDDTDKKEKNSPIIEFMDNAKKTCIHSLKDIKLEPALNDMADIKKIISALNVSINRKTDTDNNPINDKIESYITAILSLQKRAATLLPQKNAFIESTQNAVPSEFERILKEGFRIKMEYGSLYSEHEGLVTLLQIEMNNLQKKSLEKQADEDSEDDDDQVAEASSSSPSKNSSKNRKKKKKKPTQHPETNTKSDDDAYLDKIVKDKQSKTTRSDPIAELTRLVKKHEDHIKTIASKYVLSRRSGDSSSKGNQESLYASTILDQAAFNVQSLSAVNELARLFTQLINNTINSGEKPDAALSAIQSLIASVDTSNNAKTKKYLEAIGYFFVTSYRSIERTDSPSVSAIIKTYIIEYSRASKPDLSFLLAQTFDILVKQTENHSRFMFTTLDILRCYATQLSKKIIDELASTEVIKCTPEIKSLLTQLKHLFYIISNCDNIQVYEKKTDPIDDQFVKLVLKSIKIDKPNINALISSFIVHATNNLSAHVRLSDMPMHYKQLLSHSVNKFIGAICYNVVLDKPSLAEEWVDAEITTDENRFKMIILYHIISMCVPSTFIHNENKNSVTYLRHSIDIYNAMKRQLNEEKFIPSKHSQLTDEALRKTILSEIVPILRTVSSRLISNSLTDLSVKILEDGNEIIPSDNGPFITNVKLLNENIETLAKHYDAIIDGSMFPFVKKLSSGVNHNSADAAIMERNKRYSALFNSHVDTLKSVLNQCVGTQIPFILKFNELLGSDPLVWEAFCEIHHFYKTSMEEILAEYPLQSRSYTQSEVDSIEQAAFAITFDQNIVTAEEQHTVVLMGNLTDHFIDAYLGPIINPITYDQTIQNRMTEAVARYYTSDKPDNGSLISEFYTILHPLDLDNPMREVVSMIFAFANIAFRNMMTSGLPDSDKKTYCSYLLWLYIQCKNISDYNNENDYIDKIFVNELLVNLPHHEIFHLHLKRLLTFNIIFSYFENDNSNTIKSIKEESVNAFLRQTTYKAVHQHTEFSTRLRNHFERYTVNVTVYHLLITLCMPPMDARANKISEPAKHINDIFKYIKTTTAKEHYKQLKELCEEILLLIALMLSAEEHSNSMACKKMTITKLVIELFVSKIDLSKPVNAANSETLYKDFKRQLESNTVISQLMQQVLNGSSTLKQISFVRQPATELTQASSSSPPQPQSRNVQINKL